MRQAIIVGIIVLSLTFLSSGCARTDHASDGFGNANGISSGDAAANANISIFNPATTKAINIKDDSFDPPVVQIAVGDTITWTNTVQTEHGIKAEFFSSGNLRQGETFSYQFPTAGTYDYACGLHPDMIGQIIVK